jgi:pimeloyl-ACP methyl ester carboxylesterase
MVLCGRQDAWSPLGQHEEMAGMIPGAMLEVIDDSGHMVTMEQPERVAHAMLHWLRAPMADRAKERRWAS